MKYDSQLVDLPVVDRISGELVGTMRGVVCQPGKKKIDGIVYEERGWLHRCHFIPWQAIIVIGEKSIVVDRSIKDKSVRNVACPNHDSKVFNAEGNYVGRISNYLIDERSGAVLGLELSASVMDDLKFGRKIIENRGNIMKGEDFLILADSQETGNTEQNERRSENERLY